MVEQLDFSFSKQNPLLIKTEVGHTKHSIYSLPCAAHKYGKASPIRNYSIDEGMKLTLCNQFSIVVNHTNLKPITVYRSITPQLTNFRKLNMLSTA